MRVLRCAAVLKGKQLLVHYRRVSLLKSHVPRQNDTAWSHRYGDIRFRRGSLLLEILEDVALNSAVDPVGQAVGVL